MVLGEPTPSVFTPSQNSRSQLVFFLTVDLNNLILRRWLSKTNQKNYVNIKKETEAQQDEVTVQRL